VVVAAQVKRYSVRRRVDEVESVDVVRGNAHVLVRGAALEVQSHTRVPASEVDPLRVDFRWAFPEADDTFELVQNMIPRRLTSVCT
jgi:hypothetical protein